MFAKMASKMAQLSGSSTSFMLALALIVIWLLSGPLFRFSDTWQLVINTSTTIITFLMVFIIQNTQNRDTQALQLKLDELLRIHGEANNSLMDLEEMDEEHLCNVRAEYEKLAQIARKQLAARQNKKPRKSVKPRSE